jgi:hypothetical protein
MYIDARELELQDLFRKLKEILASKLGEDVFLEILIQNRGDVKRIKTFVALSGCQTAVEEREGNYLVRITGSPCCV